MAKNTDMTFTKDEQCAIVYTCLSIAHEDYDFAYSEQRFIAETAMKLGYIEEDLERVKRMNLDSAVDILKRMSYEKKEHVREIYQSLAEADGKVVESEFSAIITLLGLIHEI